MNKEINLNSINKAYFAGIGGIGLSALAQMFILKGAEVLGSDSSKSNITEKLKEKSAKIFIGHNAENVPQDADIFVHTTALSENNPELLRAKELEIPVFTYPELLGAFSRDYKTIAVSGTHGKTTTTGMASSVLRASNFDPVVIVGSLLKETGSNFIAGEGEYLLVEACEYKRAFLNLSPEILIITNIEEEHLDYYEDIEDIKSAFASLVEKVPENGYIICNTKDKNTKDVLRNARATIFNYKDFVEKTEFLKNRGKHNVLNGSCVMALAEGVLKVNQNRVKEALLDYKGTWRRFEYKGKGKNGFFVYDDYAHHPSEISATLSALRMLSKDAKMTVIFQPHLFSRTRLLLSEFSKSFKDADEVIVAPIYAAREKDDGSINSFDLADKIKENNKEANVVESFSKISSMIKASASKGDYIITMGAGDIFKVGENLVDK